MYISINCFFSAYANINIMNKISIWIGYYVSNFELKTKLFFAPKVRIYLFFHLLHSLSSGWYFMTQDRCKICQKIVQNAWYAWVIHIMVHVTCIKRLKVAKICQFMLQVCLNKCKESSDLDFRSTLKATYTVNCLQCASKMWISQCIPLF